MGGGRLAPRALSGPARRAACYRRLLTAPADPSAREPLWLTRSAATAAYTINLVLAGDGQILDEARLPLFDIRQRHPSWAWRINRASFT
jgi:hypothetical protein